VVRVKEPVRSGGLGWREGEGLCGDFSCPDEEGFACEQLSERDLDDIEAVEWLISYLLNLRV